MFGTLLAVVVVLLVLGVVFGLWCLGDGSTVTGVIAVLCFIGAVGVFLIMMVLRDVWAGQGDAVVYAKQWAEKWRPGSEVECQPRDTDGNRKVSCTIGWTNPDGTKDVEALDCGINRWYYGWKTEGCNLMKGYSGSQ